MISVATFRLCHCDVKAGLGNADTGGQDRGAIKLDLAIAG